MTNHSQERPFLTDKETAARYRVSPSTVWR